MRKARNYIVIKPALLTCSFFLFYSLLCLLSVDLYAQNSKKELYDQTIDRFNFTTIQYVLADDKQKPEAGKLATQLEELQGNTDSLITKIVEVYGPNSKTQILSATINGFKSKYVEDRALGRQFADVGKFIREDRKGKSYLSQLEKDLQSIEEEALLKASTLAGADNTQAQMQNASLTSASTMSQAAQVPSSQQAELPMWVILLIGVIGIASLANLYLYYKLFQRRRTSSTSKEDSHRTVYQVRDFEIFPRIEKNAETLEKKIEDLRKEMYALVGERKNGAVPAMEQVKLPATLPVTVEQRESLPKPVAQTTTVEPGKVVEFQLNKPAPDSPKTLKKYADYPKENGFVMSQLQDSSDRRSIYELTIPPDSDYAHFTIVDNKELHEYAIQNRERLLKDACDFEVSSSQHTKIEVLRPGKLQKNGNTWQIRHKAQIKFV
jgi:hypothetical protein